MNKYQNYKEKKQITLTGIRIRFVLILILTLFTALIVFPNISNKIPASNFFNKFKIHLGLDLQGGAHLVYQANLSAFKNPCQKPRT